MNFEEYLTSKKIDARVFQSSEQDLFNSWKKDFEQMHPNSFTVQKLNLINPIRRKYQLKQSLPKPDEASPNVNQPKPGRPVIKPKPKIN